MLLKVGVSVMEVEIGTLKVLLKVPNEVFPKCCQGVNKVRTLKI